MENFYKQYDGTIDLYNDKFAKPAKSIMDKLYAANKLTKTPFDEKLEWTYYEMWHHQGRRARMGTAMMGPDYTQWHGFYEVAKTFYNEFIPEAEALMPGVTTEVMNSPYHAWTKGLTKEQIQDLVEYVLTLSGQPVDAVAAARGKELFPLCTECHGAQGRGYKVFGGPDLTDKVWLYGGDRASITDSLTHGRMGHCPAWVDKLDEALESLYERLAPVSLEGPPEPSGGGLYGGSGRAPPG